MGIQFKGSQLDRSLSYGNINKQLTSNSQQETLADAFRRNANEKRQIAVSPNENSTTAQQEEQNHEPSESSGRWLIEELFGGFGGAGDTDDDAYKRKKRNNNNNNDNQMSR